MAPARLVAIDLDGTLLRSDQTVSGRSKAAIAAVRSAGIEVVVATARSPRSTRGLAAEAGIGGLAICANGATVYDLDADRVVAHTPLPAATAHRLVVGLRERFPGIVFGWEYELRFGSEPAYEAQRDDDWWPRPEGSYEPCDPLEWTLPMTKLLARLPTADLEQRPRRRRRARRARRVDDARRHLVRRARGPRRRQGGRAGAARRRSGRRRR